MTSLIMTADKIGLHGLADWFKRQVTAYNEWKATRSTINELNKLTDRELNDIGIARGDIYAIARGDETLERVRRDNLKENANLKGWV